LVRLAQKPMLIDIQPCLGALVAYFSANKDVAAAYLYGSYQTEMQTPLSDVDMAVLFSSKKKSYFEGAMRLEADVTAICDCDDINILALNDAPVVMQFKVISTGRLLYVRDSTALSDFQELVCKFYADFMSDYLQFCRDYDYSVREAYIHGRQGKAEGKNLLY